MNKYSIHHLGVVRSPARPYQREFELSHLERLSKDEEFKAALFLASPTLLSEFEKSIYANTLNKNDKLIYSILKYAIRMHTRCTPFGFFSGCGVVDFSKNSIFKKSHADYSIRLDMQYTGSLVDSIHEDPDLVKHLFLFTNTTVYPIGDTFRYIQYSQTSTSRLYTVTEVESDQIVKKIITQAKYGKWFGDLVEAVMNDHKELQRIEVEEYILTLFKEQILVSNLEPSATGEDHLSSISAKLKSINSTAKINSSKLNAFKKFESLFNSAPDSYLNTFNKVRDLAEKLGVSFDSGKLIQADSFQSFISVEKKSDLVTTEEASDKLIHRAINILNLLNEKRYGNTELLEFKKRFYDRYENEAVPLSLALDNESGIGYGKNNSMPKGKSYNGKEKNQITLDKLHMFLFERLSMSYRNQEYVLNITENDLEDFNVDWNDLPATMALFYKHVGQRNGESVLQIKSLMGSSAVNLLGRFALGSDPIRNLIEDVVKEENRYYGDNVVVAEIAHLPQERTGNVILRPSLRHYEIPYLSISSLPTARQISINDLYLIIKNKELILFSKRMNKRVIPRMSNAHNFSFGDLPIYHFLCDYQSYGIRTGLSFTWGNTQKVFNFFPRVQVGENIILSPAMWKLQASEITNVVKNTEIENLVNKIEEWRIKHRIPDLALLIEGDNELLINFKSLLTVRMFLNEIKTKNTIVLTEFIFEEKEAIVIDRKNNKYTNEFIRIINFNKDDGTNEEYELTKSINSHGDGDRTFLPGTEWVYYNIYCGESISDAILFKHLRPMIRKFLKKRWIRKWFFVRYADTDFHIRLRFKLKDMSCYNDVSSSMANLLSKLQKNRLIWKVRLDTYNRELERYGKYVIEEMEMLFYIDSSIILDRLEQITENKSTQMALSMSILDNTLTFYGLSLERKLEFCERVKNIFYEEFKVDKSAKIIFDKQYRDKRQFINEIFEPNTLVNKHYFEKVKSEYERNRDIFYRINKLMKEKEVNVNQDYLMMSQIHMSVNRIFSSTQRMNELVLYHFVCKYYRQEKAFVRK